jgi:hypothetical protein
MRANTIAITIFVLLFTFPILACGGASSSGGSDVPLHLLPDDTDLVEVLSVSEILGGDVPEVLEQEFDTLWETFSVGDDHLLINDVEKLFRVLSKDGVFLIISSSQLDFLETREWLADQDSGIESTSYQGEDLWESAGQAMVLLESDGYLITGDTEAIKNLLKVKARGEGSLDQDDENVVRQALDDAGAGWYTMADKNCGGAWSELRGCEAYSITGSTGDKKFEAAVTYRFRFRSESRAEDQELEVEDVLDDWLGGDADLETDSSGATISVVATADQEDFQTRWLGGYVNQPPPPLPGKTSPETDRAALVALDNGGAGGVESRVKEQFGYGNEKDWRDLYETYSEDCREENSYDDWRIDIEGGMALAGLLNQKLRATDFEVEVDGNTAYASYKARGDDVVVVAVEREVWVREDGEWYQKDC